MSSYRILIVEDEEPIRKGIIYTYSWGDIGCIVVGEAANGVEGLEKILELKPDIVVTDIGMPLMDGLEMLREAKGEVVFSSIIISVYHEFEKARSAIDLGVSNYLLKPLEHAELTAAVERAKLDLEHKRNYEKVRSGISQSNEEQFLNIRLLNDRYSNYYVNRTLAFIGDNYQKRIGLPDLVNELQVSANYINRNLKEELNQTFNEFLNRYRIQKAIERMKTGEEKIYNIATAVGYSDYKYFITVFKKYVGVSPSKLLNYYKHKELK